MNSKIKTCHEPFFRTTYFLRIFTALDSELRSDRLREHQEKPSAISKNISPNDYQNVKVFRYPTKLDCKS